MTRLQIDIPITRGMTNKQLIQQLMMHVPEAQVSVWTQRGDRPFDSDTTTLRLIREYPVEDAVQSTSNLGSKNWPYGHDRDGRQCAAESCGGTIYDPCTLTPEEVKQAEAYADQELMGVHPHEHHNPDQGGFCSQMVVREDAGDMCGLLADHPMHSNRAIQAHKIRNHRKA